MSHLVLLAFPRKWGCQTHYLLIHICHILSHTHTDANIDHVDNALCCYPDLSSQGSWQRLKSDPVLEPCPFAYELCKLWAVLWLHLAWNPQPYVYMNIILPLHNERALHISRTEFILSLRSSKCLTQQLGCPLRHSHPVSKCLSSSLPYPAAQSAPC